MVLPKHSHCVNSSKGPLLQGGDPAITLWDNPNMRGVDKVSPLQLIEYLYFMQI
jgi:hypothetical protein